MVIIILLRQRQHDTPAEDEANCCGFGVVRRRLWRTGVCCTELTEGRIPNERHQASHNTTPVNLFYQLYVHTIAFSASLTLVVGKVKFTILH